MPRCGTFLLYRSKVEVFLFCSKGAVPLGQNAAVEVGRHRSKEKNMKNKNKIRLAGALAGIVNGVFGGGGGMVLLPLLSRWSGLTDRRLFATSVAVIFPICVVSAAVYFFRAELPLLTALPYLIGGAVGGLIGGVTFEKVPVGWLKVIFALFLLYGGVKYLL